MKRIERFTKQAIPVDVVPGHEPKRTPAPRETETCRLEAGGRTRVSTKGGYALDGRARDNVAKTGITAMARSDSGKPAAPTERGHGHFDGPRGNRTERPDTRPDNFGNRTERPDTRPDNFGNRADYQPAMASHKAMHVATGAEQRQSFRQAVLEGAPRARQPPSHLDRSLIAGIFWAL